MANVQVEAMPESRAKTVGKQPKPASDVAEATHLVSEPVREVVESGVNQAKQAYEQYRSAAEEATETLEESFDAVMRGAREVGEQIAAAIKTDACAQFDLVRDLARAGTPAELLDVQSRFLNARIDTAGARMASFAKLANRIAEETGEPVRESVLRTIRTLTPAA